MTLEERLKEIEAKGYDKETKCACGTDVPALLRMLRLAIQQRGNILGRELGGYEWESVNERYDEELLKAGEG